MKRKYPCSNCRKNKRTNQGRAQEDSLFEMRNNAEAVAAFGTGRQNRPTFYQALAKRECPLSAR